jgi:hypothetical protein
VKATKSAQRRTTPPLRINVKVKEKSSPGECQGILSRLKGVQSVVQTFPEESDEELKRLFVLEVKPAELETALKELRRRSEVEYAEKAPLRKLIR